MGLHSSLTAIAAHAWITARRRAWFDSNVDAHYHFHDTTTGALIDVPIPDVEFSRLPAPPAGTEVAGIDIVIRLRRWSGERAELFFPSIRLRIPRCSHLGNRC